MLGRSRSQVYGLWRNTTSPYINEKIFSMKRKKKRKTTITTGLREENKNWRPILNSNSITCRNFLFILDESISYTSVYMAEKKLPKATPKMYREMTIRNRQESITVTQMLLLDHNIFFYNYICLVQHFFYI